MLFMVAPLLLCLVEKVLEAGQVELAAQVQLVCDDCARVLAELVQSFNCPRAVLASQIGRNSQLARSGREVVSGVLIVRRGCVACANFTSTHAARGTCLMQWQQLLGRLL